MSSLVVQPARIHIPISPVKSYVNEVSRTPLTNNTQYRVIRWKRPNHPVFFVVNCDGSYRSSKDTCGNGVILRDPFGRFISAKTDQFPGFKEEAGQYKYGTMVLKVEMMAILDGVRLAKKFNFIKNLEIQSDSETVVSILHGAIKCPQLCLNVLAEIQSEITWFQNFKFMFVYREGNRAADFFIEVLNLQWRDVLLFTRCIALSTEENY